MAIDIGLVARRGLIACALASMLAAAPARAQTVLNFWDMVWGPPEYSETAKKLVDRYNAENPKIQVKYRAVPWANWYQTYVTAIGAGTAPDLSTGAGYQPVQLYDQGAIHPIDDLVAELKASGELDDFLPGTVERLKYDGHYVSLPWAVDIRVWLYRKDLLAAAKIAPPTNWAELRAAAKALTAGDKYGVAASGDTGGSHYLYSLMVNNGGGLFDAKRTLTVQAPRNLEALEFLAGIVKDGSVSPASAGYDSAGRRRAFMLGQAAFILDGPGLPDSGTPEAREQIGVLPPLSGMHGDKGTVAWTNSIMVYEQTRHYAETKDFLKWWSRNQKPLWTEGHAGPMPARMSFHKDPYFKDSALRSFIVENYLPLGKTTGANAPGIFAALNALEGDGVMQSLTQEILQGKDVGPGLAKAEGKLKTIVQ